VEEIPFELVSPKEDGNHLVPEVFKTTFTNPLFDFESEYTLISDNPIFDIQNEESDESVTEQGFTDLYLVNNSLHEEFAGGLTHINGNENPINGLFEQNDLHHLLPAIESFYFEDVTVGDISISFLSEDKIFKPGILPREETHPHTKLTPDKNLKSQTSSEEFLILEHDYFDLKKDHSLEGDALIQENLHINDKIPSLPPRMFSKPKSLTDKIQSSATALDPENEDLVMMVIRTFYLFFTYPVTSPLFNSCGSEDTIFDPGIFSYHSFKPGISHRCGTFTSFNVCLNILNESPMEIVSYTCFPKNQ
jgi:hypothetical protein